MPTKRMRRAEVREAGMGKLPAADQPKPAPADVPPDPQDLGRPMTDDEKIDEALLESMDASDPPSIGAPSRVGSPKERKSPPVQETVKKQQAAE
jgi:hypothetical protein